MKRPLAFLALCLTAAVTICLLLCPPRADRQSLLRADSDILSETIPENSTSNQSIVLEGRVIRKEWRRNYQGEKIPILYLQAGKARILCEFQPAGEAGDDTERQGDEAHTGNLARIGETIRIRGRWKEVLPATNPGEFDSRLYDQIMHIDGRISGAVMLASDGNVRPYGELLSEIRNWCAAGLDAAFTERDAAVLKGMLLGDKSDLDADLKSLYQGAGIIHILAISGLHISFLGSGLYKLLKRLRLPSALAVILAVLVMLSYGWMTGMSTSSLRAILMFTLRILAPVVGRTYDMLTALSLCGICMLLEEPLYLRHSGFLMSFGAILGICLLMPVLAPMQEQDPWDQLRRQEIRKQSRGERWRNLETVKLYAGDISRALWKSFAVSLSVSLVTLPVYMNFYFTFPVFSPLLNLLIIPLMGILLPVGLICMLLGHVLPMVGRGIALTGHLILLLFEQSATVEQRLPGAVWTPGAARGWLWAGYYLLLSILVAVAPRLRKWYGGIVWIWLAFAVMLLSLRLRPAFQITCLDVGQGDGIVLQTRDRVFLIDGGSSNRYNLGRYVLKPLVQNGGRNTLDAVSLTHPDEDHCSGMLELLQDDAADRIRIKLVILPDLAPSTRTGHYAELEQAAMDQEIPVAYLRRGDSIRLDSSQPDLQALCLWPRSGYRDESANAGSTTIYLRKGTFSALLTGDLEGVGLEAVTEELEEQSIPPIALLKVPHHGSRYTTDDRVLNVVNPLMAVISCGRDNDYGHPHAELLERLSRAGCGILRTDESGAVTVYQSGRDKFWVKHLQKIR